MLDEPTPVIPRHARSVYGESATAPPKPSVQTQFVLSAMDVRTKREEDRWEQFGESFESLYEEVAQISKNQQRLEVQFGLNNSVMEQMLKDQQILAKQLEVTSKTVAQLSLHQSKQKEEDPPSPTRSERSTVNPFARRGKDSDRLVQHHQEDCRDQRRGHQKFGSNRLTIPKIQFPVFDGTNPRIWRSKCQDFFELYDVPESMKATLASLNMDENASKWLQVNKQKTGIGDWEQFISAVEAKFGANDYRDAIGELLELSQTTTVEEYTTAFENLQFEICMHNDGFGDTFFVSQYRKGLKPEIGVVVQSQVPQDVDRAILLAKVQQQVLEKGKQKVQRNSWNPKSFSSTQSVKNLPGTSNLWKERQTLNYRKANNLCYHYGEKFEPGHVAVCTQRPKAHVNALVVNDLDMPLSDEVLTQLAMEDSLDNDFCHLSLNAISGVENTKTLKVRALVNNKVMPTLVDSGSSDSFVSAKFLNMVGITPLQTVARKVKLANGQILISDKWVPKLA